MAVIETALLDAPLHDTEARNRSREQGAYARGQGWPSPRRRAIGEHRGEFERHDVVRTVMPGAMVLATFAETKVARSQSERNRSSSKAVGEKARTLLRNAAEASGTMHECKALAKEVCVGSTREPCTVRAMNMSWRGTPTERQP